MGDIQVVVFSLNNEIYGADTSQVYKIEKYSEPVEIPEMPDFIEGIINLRGRVVPVINLNKRFHMGETVITKKTKVIITEVENALVGFTVNDVSGITKLSDAERELPPQVINDTGVDYLKSIGKKDDKLISVIDLSKVLKSFELLELSENKVEV